MTVPIIYKMVPEGIGVLHQTSVAQTAPLHSHADFIEAFLVASGKALHICNQHVSLLDPGTFVLIRANDTHCYDFYQNSDFEFYNISLSLTDYESLLSFFNYHPALMKHLNSSEVSSVRLSSHEVNQFISEYKHIESFIQAKQYDIAKISFKILLSNIFIEHFINDCFQNQAGHQLPQWLADLISQMHSQDALRMGLDYMVQLSGYSQAYLTRCFKKYIDLTPTQFINNLRLNLASSMLLQTKNEILQICQDCGFNNLSYFYRVFKKAYGMSPNQYRKTYCHSPHRLQQYV